MWDWWFNNISIIYKIKKKFGLKSEFVFGIDNNINNINYCKENCNTFSVNSNIEFLCCDFMKLKSFSADLVFIHPNFMRGKSNFMNLF